MKCPAVPCLAYGSILAEQVRLTGELTDGPRTHAVRERPGLVDGLAHDYGPRQFTRLGDLAAMAYP